MTASLLSAAVTCLVSLALGQAALRLVGAREWSWLAPPVGISVAMLISASALHVPGGCATVAVLLAALTLAAIIWCGRDAAHRPPISGLLAATPVALLVLVPFLAVGYSGVLGTSFDNDMAQHMLIVEHYLSPSTVANLAPPGYPNAPHGMVALIAKGLDMRVDHAFTGWTMALPLLSAWTALALAPRASWPDGCCWPPSSGCRSWLPPITGRVPSRRCCRPAWCWRALCCSPVTGRGWGAVVGSRWR